MTLAALKVGKGGLLVQREKQEVPFPNGSRGIPKKGAVDPAVPGQGTRNDPGVEGGVLQGGVCRDFCGGWGEWWECAEAREKLGPHPDPLMSETHSARTWLLV